MSIILTWARGHALLLLLSVGTVFNVFWLYRFRNKLALKIPVILLLSILHTAVGVLSVKVFAVIEGFGDPSAAGGMSLFGGIFFMPLFYAAVSRMTKRPAAAVFDYCTVCMVFTVMCARINCIVSGCCKGAHIVGSDGPRWPTRELEVMFYIILLYFLISWIMKEKYKGKIYLIYVMAYGCFRFIEEFFRDSSWRLGVFHKAHLWALIAFGLAGSIYAELLKKQSKKSKRRN